MKTQLYLLLFLLLSSSYLLAQNTTIKPDKACINCPTDEPTSSAVLEMQSTDKGILIPRMTSNQRTNISNLVDALLVYDTDTKSFWYYNTSQWQELDADKTNEIQSLSSVLAEDNDANNTLITNLANPLNDQDAATKAYVDANEEVDDADADPNNELQDLFLSGDTLKITNNATATNIDLSPYLDNTDTQLSETEVDNFVSNNGYLTSEVDGSTSNEIQDLELNGNILSLTDDATSVDLSGFANNWTESNGNVYRNSGKVGIGTVNPRGTLDANGNIFATGNLISGGMLAAQIHASDPTKNVLAGGIEVYGKTLINTGSNTFNIIGDDGLDFRMGAQTDTIFDFKLPNSGSPQPCFDGRNLILGDNAGHHTFGDSQVNSKNNVFLGSYAGYGDMGTIGNTLIGNNAGQNLLDANYNTMIGAGAGTNAYSKENILIGYKTGYCEIDTFLSSPGFEKSVFIGNEIAIGARSIENSVIIGHHAGRDMRGGGNNVLIGFEAGTGIISEDKISVDNIFIGNQAGKDVFTLGSILIGNNTDVAYVTDSTGLGDVIALGHDIRVDCSNCTVIGGEKVGLGISAPTERLDVNGNVKATKFIGDGSMLTNISLEDGDADAMNEIQDLELNGNTLSLTDDATTVDLSPYLDNTDTQLTETEVDNFVSNNGYLTSEVDGDSSNEIQDLELTNNTLKITNNATATDIDLSPYLDNTDTQLTETEVDNFVSNNGYLITEVDGDSSNEIQNLSLSGDTLNLSNDATAVDLGAFINNWTIADGRDATFGYNNVATGDSSTALGYNNIADTTFNTAVGYSNEATGSRSSAFGYFNEATGSVSSAVGYVNDATGGQSSAFGYNNDATGFNCNAFGTFNAATEFGGSAFGTANQVTGIESSAFGYANDATGDFSSAVGHRNFATGDESSAFGYETVSNVYGLMAVGRYNADPIGSATTWIATDPVFVIGNGENSNNRSTALTILKNGSVGIGTSTPTKQLHILAGDQDGINLQKIAGTDLQQIRWSDEANALKAAISYDHQSEDINIFNAGANRIVIANDGKVGIGITSPAKELQVVGTVYANTLQSSGPPVIDIQGAYLGWNRISGSGRTLIANQRGLGSGGFEFINYNNDTTINNISMTIDGDGNVGIGTTDDPTAKLDINGTARIRSLPSGSGTAVVADGSGNLLLSSSSPNVNEQRINDLEQENELLKSENEAIKARLAKIEALLSGKVERISNTTSTLTSATLAQNAPNPFSEATTINYFIPENTKNASLQVMDQNGRIIKSIPIQATGNGQITLQANLLSAGTYSYSLILDGQVMDTKQMVLTH